MRFYLTIFSVAIFNVSFSQPAPTSSADTLANKAYRFYFEKKQIDLVLSYYQLIHKSSPVYRQAMMLHQIASCFEQMGQTTEAENYYLKCLQVDKAKDSLDFF